MIYLKKLLYKILRTQPIPFILHIIFYNYGKCERCGLPWKFCDDKSVEFKRGTEIFATCDYCWNISSLEELNKYYTNVYNNQLKTSLKFSYSLTYSLNDVLNAVEKEFYSKYSKDEILIIKRKQKIDKIKKQIK